MIQTEKILKLLTQHNIDFIIVGGIAAVAHGSARLTSDLDIVYSRTTENIDRLVTVLRPLQPYLRGAPKGLPFVWDAQTIKMGLNFTLTSLLGDIDLLGEIVGGGNYDDLITQCVEIQLFGEKYHCLSLEQLIRAKRAAGRPKDIDAVAELEAIDEEKNK